MNFYNKICLLLIILFIVSFVSVVHASDDFNDTALNDNMESVKINNNSLHDFKDNEIYNSEENQSKPNFTIICGSDIPIKINSQATGWLYISFDGKYNSTLEVLNLESEVINIPTFSDYSVSKGYYGYVLNPGIHNISFTFSFDHYSDLNSYVTDVSMNNSVLTFNIVSDYYLGVSDFKYETSFNIIKNPISSIRIVDVESLTLFSPMFKIYRNNTADDYVVFISKDNNIIYSKAVYAWEGEESCAEPNIYNDWVSVGCYDIIAINLNDRTYDSASFNVYDYVKLINLTHIIENNNITVFIKLESDHNVGIVAEICEGNNYEWIGSQIEKKLVPDDKHDFYLEFKFNNLAPGIVV